MSQTQEEINQLEERVFCSNSHKDAEQTIRDSDLIDKNLWIENTMK